MKLTKEQLQKIIKEELAALMSKEQKTKESVKKSKTSKKETK
tara:strand:+ start:113 stop:238 length:126 start_codon:yes stop_codon:yes gene_type:complete